MRDFILKYWLQILFGASTALMGKAYLKIKKTIKKQTALENGVQCLLRAEIIRSYDKYLDRGYCPVYAREALEKAYASYHALGGNDVATDLMHKLRNLPTEPKEAHYETN